MTAPRRRSLARGIVACVALIVLAGAAILLLGEGADSGAPGGSSGPGGRVLSSILEDDQLLVDQPLTPAGNATVAHTLATLQDLGVDEVRVLVSWNQIAPDPSARRRPAGFDATNPADYGGGWAAYDRLVIGAAATRLKLIFDLSTPAPAWATQVQPAGTTAAARADADVYRPSAKEFGAFITAAGRRYSGHFSPPGTGGRDLPRVSAWSMGNEPNQPGWLSPQQDRFGADAAPAIYRGLLDAFWSALSVTGHHPGSDTILFGELAPNGCVSGQFCPFSSLGAGYRAIPPITFLEQLYCVRPVDATSTRMVALSGAAAQAVGCPRRADGTAFAAGHPGLFAASGLAEHPYSFFLAPGVTDPLASEATFAPLASLSRLEAVLDGVMGADGSARRMPLYLTEYGYVTDPPNPRYPVTPAQQAAYLDEATYLAARDPRVRALGQFELQDANPAASCGCAPNSPRYWESFQEGLEYLGGAPKPALAAYAVVLFLPGLEGPTRPAAPGTATEVWGMLRAAPNGQSDTAQVQFAPVGSDRWQTLSQVRTGDPTGIFDTYVHLPGSGRLRLSWTAPDGGVQLSRVVPVTVG